jgi:molecular chaperone DnaK
MINEPTAACLAYGLHMPGDHTVVVYHLGGGTLDVSVVQFGQGVFEVKATSGDTHLGGDDFDERIIGWACAQFVQRTGIDLRSHKDALARLKEACQRAKCELSTLQETEIKLPYICRQTDGDGYHDLLLTLTRASLEALVGDLLAKTLKPCEQALADAGLRPAAIDEVILVGQQTRMPAVQRVVQAFFGREPRRDVDPAEVVALGAAVEAGILEGLVPDTLLLDVVPLTLGLETLGGVATPLIERNTIIPARRSRIFSTAADRQTRVEIHVVKGERPSMSCCAPGRGWRRCWAIAGGPRSRGGVAPPLLH